MEKEFVDKNEKQTLDYKLKDGSLVKLKYTKTAELDKKNDITHLIYTDSISTDYYINKGNGKLVRVAFNIPVFSESGSKKFSNEEAKAIAMEAVKKYTKFEDYTFDKSKSYDKGDFGYYDFIWRKYINDIPTCDEIIAQVGTNGNIFSLIVPNEGLYSQNDDTLVGLTKKYMTESKALEMLDKKVKEVESNNAVGKFMGYNVSESVLYFNRDKKLVWQFVVGITVKDTNGKEIVTGREITINANTSEVFYK